MVSMSHCCIENAADVMSQVNYKFENQQNDVQSNQYERNSLDRLYRRCKEFCDEYKAYLEDKESYIAEHSEQEDED